MSDYSKIYNVDQDLYSLEDDDIFADSFVSARPGAKLPQSLPKPLAELTEEEAAALGEKHRKIVNRKRSTKRQLEAKATNRIRNHLFKQYGAVTTRVNSGEWIDAAGNTIRGAKAGTSDVLASVPIVIGSLRFGIYFAFEVKSIENKVDGTDLQQIFIARVKATGAAGAVVRTVIDVEQAIQLKRQEMIADLRRFIAEYEAAKNSA
jgi:hypothetical protein